MTSATETVELSRSLRVGDLSSRPLLDMPPAAGGWTGVFDPSFVYDRLAQDLRRAFEIASYGVEVRAWAEEKERAEVKSFVSREAARHECISMVVADWEEDGVDLLFVVEGDLYDGESAVLPIVDGLTSAFPSVGVDLMVLPASAYDVQFRWGTAPDEVYRRH